MAFKYDSIVPWGRSYEEYIDMFGLTVIDLNKFILGCGDGPASFNCRMNQNSKKVISADPIYQFSKQEIEQKINETFNNVISQTKLNTSNFIWTKIKNADELGRIRMDAMKEFLNDYEKGRLEKRYISAELPALPFKNKEFDLSLSSHFLFLYTDNLSLDFHIASIKEMLRVSKEVRIFPLLDMNADRSLYADKIIEKFTELGYRADEVKVNYEFQKNGNKMLVIK
jgi:hypothetical protein